MGFFPETKKPSKSPLGKFSVETFHRGQCQVCPLNREPGLKNPKMDPHGSDKPLVYMLGAAPTVEDDRKGAPFSSRAANIVHHNTPRKIRDRIRWNNCVRTKPPERSPTSVEIECCRPSVVKDIERTKPRAIFGFGNIPLSWAIEKTGLSNWNRRRVPIQVGNHACWYYPMPDFYEIKEAHDAGDWKVRDLEFVFKLNLREAFAEVRSLDKPAVHTRDDALSGLEFVTGAGGKHDLDRVVNFLRSLYDEKVVGIDYETNCLRPYVEDAKILTVALSKKDQSLAFPLYHQGARWTPKQRAILQREFEDFLYGSKCRKISHGLGFEMEWTAFFYGESSLRAAPWGDTMSQAYILDERQDCLSLDFLCLQYFGINIKKIDNLDRKNLATTPVDVVLRYNALDAKYHRALYLKQAKRLKAEGLLQTYKYHLRRVPTMVLTQIKGVPVNPEVSAKFHKEYTTKLEKIESEINQLEVVDKFRKRKGKEFRPSANADVAFVVRKILKMPGEGIDEKALSKIKHPIAKLVLKWRKANKILSTYVKPLSPGSPHLYPGELLHPVLSTTKTRTWRTSSEDPNSQNFPKRKNKEVRSQIGRRGFKVVSFDYGAIQARNVAMESKDKFLIQSFWDLYDIHADWMERIVRAYPKWVDGGAKVLAKDKVIRKKYRDRAKNELVFPSFFGAQPRSLAKYLGIPENVAADLHEEFGDMFPDIPAWHARIKEEYQQLGYVTGLSGFRRRAPISPNELINAPIQADEALIVCDAMTRLSELEDDRFQANLEIHDDLTFIWPPEEVEKNAEVVIKHMLDVPFEWARVVPIVVEMSVGDDWADGMDVAQFSSDGWDGTIPRDPLREALRGQKAAQGSRTPKKRKSAPALPEQGRDPNTGSWSDGTGWANHKGMEKAR